MEVHQASRPKSKMSEVAHSNVVVIGGGIVGASIAWHLSSETNVTVIAEDIGGVATPNSFAWLNAASTDKKFYYDFRLRSMERWKEIEQVIDSLPIHWGGTTTWDQSPEELEAAKNNASAWGYDVIRVDKTEIEEIEPHVEDAILPEWGLAYGQEGALEAEIAAKQMIEQVEKRGGKFIEARAKGFTKTDGRVSGVVLDSGETIPADHVIVAAGLGSVALLATENIKLPLESSEGLLVNTKPTSRRLINGVINAPIFTSVKQSKGPYASAQATQAATLVTMQKRQPWNSSPDCKSQSLVVMSSSIAITLSEIEFCQWMICLFLERLGLRDLVLLLCILVLLMGPLLVSF